MIAMRGFKWGSSPEPPLCFYVAKDPEGFASGAEPQSKLQFFTHVERTNSTPSSASAPIKLQGGILKRGGRKGQGFKKKEEKIWGSKQLLLLASKGCTFHKGSHPISLLER